MSPYESLYVKKLVDFNGKLVMSKGKVIDRIGDCYKVSFYSNGVEFCGLWKIVECENI